MTPEGMVHALRTVHALLRPGGAVIDVRPLPVDPDLGVQRGDRSGDPIEWVGVLGETDDGIEYRLADAAMAFEVAAGRFVRESGEAFLLRRYADSLAELRGYFVKHWKDAVISPATAEAIERAAAAVRGPSRVVIREHVQIARFRRL